jgi:hypothetical protein
MSVGFMLYVGARTAFAVDLASAAEEAGWVSRQRLRRSSVAIDPDAAVSSSRTISDDLVHS